MARQYNPDEINALLHDAGREAQRPQPVTPSHVGAQVGQSALSGLGAILLVGGGLYLLRAPADVLAQGALLAGVLVLGAALVWRAVPENKMTQFRRIQQAQRLVIEATFRKEEAYRRIVQLEQGHAVKIASLEKSLLALRNQNNILRMENDELRERLNPQSANHVTMEEKNPDNREKAAFILGRWFATLRTNERGETVGDWYSRRDAERANWTQDQHADAVGLLKRAGIVTPRGNFYRVIGDYPDLPSALHRLDTYYAEMTRGVVLPKPRRSYVDSNED